MNVSFTVTIEESTIDGIDDRSGNINIFLRKNKIGAIDFLILADQLYIVDTKIYNEKYRNKGYGTQALEIIKGISRALSKPILTDYESNHGFSFYTKNGFKCISNSRCMVWLPEQLRDKNEIIVTNI